ncbi:hypothetical protein HDE_03661 [Halotydeus destructor]|nr:hypothetical protein HDE_03661 [Halotydeus destructor]
MTVHYVLARSISYWRKTVPDHLASIGKDSIKCLSDYSDNVPTVWDKGPYQVDENVMCQRMALKEKENGYLLCDGTCYVMGTVPLRPMQRKIPGADEIKCKTYVIVNPGSDAQTALNEPDLDEIKKTLEDLVLKKTLSFTVSKGSEGKDVPEASYIVDNMQVAPSIMRRTEQQKFVQTFTGSKIKSSSETALVKPEAETLGACYRQCVDDESMNCQSFSFCHLNSKFHCTISSNRLAIGLPKSDLESYLEPDTQCSVYNVPYINRYIKLGDKTAWMLGGVTVDSKLVKDVDDCAQQCSKSTPDSCESFQYCSTGHCIIHKEHYHDLGDSGKKLVTDDDCDFYSQNYLLDYTMAGSDLVAENTALEQFAEVSADLCAQRCSKRDDCVSMNYCPGNTNSPSRCSLNSKSVFDSDTETVSRPLCRTYEKIVEKPPQPKTIRVPETKKDTSGFSGVGFFLLVLVMFASGIGLGVGAFVAMNHYSARSGRTESSLNIFVKFSRREGEAGQNETQDF